MLINMTKDEIRRITEKTGQQITRKYHVSR
jgi:hypothetical protein